MSAHISPSGDVLTEESWNKESNKYLPTKDDNLFIESLMTPVSEPGVYADWIAAPDLGIDNKPGDFEYVKIHDSWFSVFKKFIINWRALQLFLNYLFLFRRVSWVEGEQ